MKCPLPAIFLLAAAAFAQTGTDYDPLAVVGSFLQLTDSQVKAIRTNNTELDEWADSKWTRIGELYDEIDKETGRDVPDPNAVGIRYVEIEYIWREMDARERDNRQRNVGLLTEDQKARLEVLEIAAKLEPFAFAAGSVNLLDSRELDFFASAGPEVDRMFLRKAKSSLGLSQAAAANRMRERSGRSRVRRSTPSRSIPQ